MHVWFKKIYNNLECIILYSYTMNMTNKHTVTVLPSQDIIVEVTGSCSLAGKQTISQDIPFKVSF